MLTQANHSHKEPVSNLSNLLAVQRLLMHLPVVFFGLPSFDYTHLATVQTAMSS